MTEKGRVLVVHTHMGSECPKTLFSFLPLYGSAGGGPEGAGRTEGRRADGEGNGRGPGESDGRGRVRLVREALAVGRPAGGGWQGVGRFAWAGPAWWVGS
ncbi:hypothetical protein Lesp01_21590 [Lentzea sp. NBRC 102530]|nr:hypothetical protein Lesp01_21590 [Lentzea sp. NBRC 102530]